MTKQQKEYIILGILLLAIGYVVYVNFIKKVKPASDSAVEAETAATAAASKPFLPYGTKLDIGVVKDSKFKTLIPPSYPDVTRGDVGLVDPFGTQ